MSGWKRIFGELLNYPYFLPPQNFDSNLDLKLEKWTFCVKTHVKINNLYKNDRLLQDRFYKNMVQFFLSKEKKNEKRKFVNLNKNCKLCSYISLSNFEKNKQKNFLWWRSLTIKSVDKFKGHRFLHKRTFKTIRKNVDKRKITDEVVSWLKTFFSNRRWGYDSSMPPNLQFFMKQSGTQDGSQSNESERLKIAFAEGYLSGSRQISSSPTPRWMKVLQPVLTVLIIVGLSLAFLVTANGSIFKMQIGKQIEIDPVEINVTFEDVKGVDEAKQELKEVVEFLKNPEKFSVLGGKLPKGVLLVGPPGTGKTLLARAVAGEAKVPFFHAAGPEFDEVLVGQGARRVRDLFKAAKEAAPCVVFIDEIDSVGSKRTNSVLHPYANQTINQLLSEMDGFHQNEGVIILGATNRREDLDKALLRPGRFDVEVVVPTPDYNGRKQIFEFYLNKILCRNVDIDILARGTVGFTGADIENMVNQAAVKAAVEGAECVTMTYLENARDKVLMGPEKKTRIPDEEANLITAYHEGGHTIVGFYTKDAHPLHKVTIMPRGPSLGHTAYIPEKERYHVTKSQLLAIMDTMMGGRAAEELIFGPDKITSGSSNDLKQATLIATHMVKEWGMSEKIGLRAMNDNEKPVVSESEFGQATKEAIDSEIKKILSESYERAKSILKDHSQEHKLLAEALIKYETLDADDIKAILTGKKKLEGNDKRQKKLSEL